MSSEWSTIGIADCLVPVSVGARGKLQTKDYKTTGRFPVIDQGQELVAGWTDEESAVIDAPLPLVVFGDHTRAFKYIDFPFARGADGTQLLRPKEGIDPLFFFYACRAIDLPARGYNRHFTVLKEKVFSYPRELQEQTEIAAALRQTELAIAMQSRLLTTTEKLKSVTMRELFARGLRGEARKDTETREIPESWSVVRLDACADVISTRMPCSELEALPASQDTDAVVVLGIKVSDMNRPGNETELSSAALATKMDHTLAESRCAPPGTIIFPKRGAAIATNKKRLATTWTVFDPNVIGVRAKGTLNPRFLFQWFQSFDLRTITEPGPTPQLNKKNLEPLLVPVPPVLAEQKEIVEVLDALDHKIALHRRKGAVLEGLFDSLLHKLMTNEIRVEQLNLSALAPTTPDGAA